MDFFQQLQKIHVTTGQRLDINLNSGKARVRGQQIGNAFNKTPAPFCVPEPGSWPGWSANPGYHTKIVELGKKSLRLGSVNFG